MKKLYRTAPLPFQGQKRKFVRKFVKVIKNYYDGVTFVDLFGGSGLLSHTVKYYKPKSKVVYNDYDGFSERIKNIPITNQIINEIRKIVQVPHLKPIVGGGRNAILNLLKEKECFVDYITISKNILFSGRYVTNYEDLLKEGFYNMISKNEYAEADDYLDGLTIVKMDYRDLFELYKDDDKAVFIVDPPYLNTDCGTYSEQWSFEQYFDVLKLLKGKRFIYFTSSKYKIVEMCNFFSKNNVADVFDNCIIENSDTTINHTSNYTDIMIFNDNYDERTLF